MRLCWTGEDSILFYYRMLYTLLYCCLRLFAACLAFVRTLNARLLASQLTLMPPRAVRLTQAKLR
jgi:hypothetical protein